MRLGSGMNLYLVLIISAIAFFTLLAYPILFVFPKLNKLVHDYQLSNLNDQLDLVMSLVKLYHSDSIADLMDEESAKKEVLKQIKSFLYGPEGKDYFFVLDTNGVVLAHPYYPELEGQSGLESDDVVFKKAVGNIVQGARQGKNCVEYEWYIYGERKTQRKLTVIRVFEPWSWIIGTGFYRQVLTEQIRKIRMNFWQVEGIFATSFLLILIVQVMKRYHLEKEQLLNKFQQEKERLHAILSSIPTPIIIFEELEPTFMNEAFKSTFSIEKSNVEVFRSNILEALKQFAMEAQKKKTSMNRSLRLNDVQERWFHVHIVPRFENGICEVIFVLTEITEHMQEINLWKTRAETDTLTGLANRSILRELEEHTFVLGKNFCVLMLDVDDFKQINDKYGHTVGDLVLKEFAKRLSQSVRKDAVLIRYGGDEFLTIIPNIDVENALRVAKRFQESLKQKFNALEVTLILSASIGISEFPKDGHDLQSLIDSADKRLYKAKASGKGSICAD
ncbi:diguanylate cyclase [Pseudothermotoga sp.]|uniref:diguanylate cyclase n=1 Tax=Pseudothermotoga sp. TaxID=2033661 RepID=UPI0031F69984